MHLEAHLKVPIISTYNLSFFMVYLFGIQLIKLFSSSTQLRIKLKLLININERTKGPVNAHLISWPRISI